jgi:hypothetical protein
MAGIIGEAESILCTGFAGASEAHILARLDPLAKLVAVQ